MVSKRCSGTTSTDIWRPFQCSRNGRFEEGGKHYCKQHLPSDIKRRDAEAKAKFDLKWATKKHGWALADARSKIADIAIAVFSQDASFDDIEKAVNEYHALKAKGPFEKEQT